MSVDCAESFALCPDKKHVVRAFTKDGQSRESYRLGVNFPISSDLSKETEKG